MTVRTVRTLTIPVGPTQRDIGRRGQLWRLPRVLQECGLSRSTIRRLELEEKFPPRVRLSGNAVGWWSGQIEDWKAAREPADTG